MLVCALPLLLHTRPRAHRAPGIPCALDIERAGNLEQTSGVERREIAKVWLHVIARSESDEAIHSSFAPRDELLRFARNDDLRFRRVGKGTFRAVPTISRNRKKWWARR